MQCPYCAAATRVIDSRPADASVRRRRLCQGCGRRFTTHERLAAEEPLVVKRSGRREPFQHDKLLHGIRLACAKRALPTDRLEEVAEAVRTRVMQQGSAEVRSEEVGEWVLERLRAVDQVAAFRFAAVFRRPPDTEAVRRELAAAEAAPPVREAAAAASQPTLPGLPGADDGASLKGGQGEPR